MQLKNPFKRGARGFTLVELAIATTIAAMGATIGLYYKAQEVRYDLVHNQVDQLKSLAQAVSKYETTYASNIVANTAVNNVVVTRAPTIAELKTLNLLDNNFNPVNYYPGSATPQGSYKILLRNSPAGCTGVTCGVFGIVYTTTPVVDGNFKLDNAAIGEAIVYGGGDVGASTTFDKTTVKGYNAGWSEPNPVTNTAGILAVRVIYAGDTSTTTTTSGNLDMNNKAITSVDYISGTVGQDLQIKTANGKDLYLQNINDTPSSNMYANFQNSTFTNDVTALGTYYGRSGSGYGMVLGASNGALNSSAQSSTGSLNANDVYVRSAGKWASEIASSGFTSVTPIAITSGASSQALGTFKFCALTGVETNLTAASQPTTQIRQTVTGTYGGAWTYTSTSPYAKYGQVTCLN